MAPTWTIFALLVFGGIFILADAECPEKWTKISPKHTMCLTDIGKEIPVTDEMKKAVVARHNEIRGQVSPPAADMQKMEYSEALAEVAAKWARQCSFPHDMGNLRLVPELPGVWIGQNIARARYEYEEYNIVTATNSWAEEVENFTYGVVRPERNGHYIQQIWNETGLIGCGAADCSESDWFRTYIVCNYAVWFGETETRTEADAYTAGDACAACPGSCENKLCDCGGLVCQNGGTPDVSTCNCKCPPVYSGKYCETKSCGTKDSDWCAWFRKANPTYQCTKYTVWLHSRCPAWCAGCP